MVISIFRGSTRQQQRHLAVIHGTKRGKAQTSFESLRLEDPFLAEFVEWFGKITRNILCLVLQTRGTKSDLEHIVAVSKVGVIVEDQ